MEDIKKTISAQIEILPDFPRTPYLPWGKKADRENLGLSLREGFDILNPIPEYGIRIEEKIDGANCGMCLYNSEPIIRNRNYVLRKGYGRKKTANKLQFAPVWNWFYEHQSQFAALNDFFGFTVGVYGEWLYLRHTVNYDKLPSIFIAYDVYNCDEQYFVAPDYATFALTSNDFSVPEQFVLDKPKPEDLLAKIDEKSIWSSTDKREGLYVKTYDRKQVLTRCKIVREDFEPGLHTQEVIRNKVAR